MCLRFCADKLSALVAGTGPHIRCEGRKLRTATDLRAVRKSLLADHLDVPGGKLSQVCFRTADGWVEWRCCANLGVVTRTVSD